MTTLEVVERHGIRGVRASDGAYEVWVPFAVEYKHDQPLMVQVTKRRARAMLRYEMDRVGADG